MAKMEKEKPPVKGEKPGADCLDPLWLDKRHPLREGKREMVKHHLQSEMVYSFISST